MIKSNKLIVSSLLVFLFSNLIFYYLVQNDFGDLPSHIYIIYQISQGRLPLPGNFLLYFIVTLTNIFAFQKLLTIFLLSVAITLKFTVSIYIIKKCTPQISQLNILVLSYALLFVFALPNLNLIFKNYYYLGSYVPNVWHNTTIMFLMPFSLILYYTIFIKPQTIVINIVLIFLNIFIKPSFIFVLVPLLFINQLFTYENSKIKIKFNFNWRYFIYIFVSLLFILIQFYIIYRFQSGDKNGVKISFFDSFENTWEFINIPINIILSFLFPISVLIFVKRKNIHIINAVIISLVAIVISYSLIETGERRAHGNFSWQIIPAAYLLFLFSIIQVLKNRDTLKKWKYVTICICFCLHLAYGIFYFLKILITNNFF